MINEKIYKKSIITLEEIRPYIKTLSGYFGVPFGDGGFLMSSDEIEIAKVSFESHFFKVAALFMGMTEKDTMSKTKKKSEYDGKPYNWCWKHNKSYTLKQPNEDILSFSINISERDYFHIYINDDYNTGIGSYCITEDGEIYQDKNSEDLTLAQMRERIKAKKMEDANKELKKRQTALDKAKKSLATMTKKVKELEDEIAALSKI